MGSPLLLASVIGFVAFVGISLFQPCLTWCKIKVSWPSVNSIHVIIVFTAADTLTAAFALHVLFPSSIELTFIQLYTSFLLAFSIGLISGTTGGIGPFEKAFWAFFPMHPAAPLHTSIPVYRVIHYAGSALYAIVILARGPLIGSSLKTSMRKQAGGASWLPSHIEILVNAAPRTKANLLRQSGETWDRLPYLYKIGARWTSQARNFCFVVVPVSREARLRPQNFDLTLSPRRQLRRKLRQADKAGISMTPLQIQSDLNFSLQEMEWVAHQSALKHGGERRFSMGNFSQSYLQTQRCFLAQNDEALVGLVRFSTVAAEWTLDLIRHTNVTHPTARSTRSSSQQSQRPLTKKCPECLSLQSRGGLPAMRPD